MSEPEFMELLNLQNVNNSSHSVNSTNSGSDKISIRQLSQINIPVINVVTMSL